MTQTSLGDLTFPSAPDVRQAQAFLERCTRDAITIVNELGHDVLVVHRFDGLQAEVEGVVEPVLPSGADSQYRRD